MPLKEVNWNEFVFRCYYFGELMTPVKGKSNLERYNDALSAHDTHASKLMSSNKAPTDIQLLRLNELDKKVKELKLYKDIPTFSGTAKRRLSQIYTEETTGRIKDIESVYLEKGLMTEEDSITLYSLRYGKMYRKNKERLSNGFVTGEIDFDDSVEDLVIDTKSTWDIFTFYDKLAKGIGLLYEWQGQMYMWLKNRKTFRLAYCLNNTPEPILAKLIKRMEYNFIGSGDDFEEAKKLLREKHTYNDIPDEERIICFDLKRDDYKIDMAKTYIPHFREYLANFKNIKNEEYETED